ncbi:MAG: acyltransferase family protein [Cyanobacteriota bacterium]|nr:acyltransferase family protein [Cyanobacteriota bacterium]
MALVKPDLPPLRLGYRPEIDGLRALAVIAVILNHTRSEWLPSGYLGVDIFFVISGFVITSSLLTRGREAASEFFLGFYARRFKRILPALVVFVLLAGAAIAWFSPGGPSIRTGVAALFGLANMYLFREAVDYFGRASEMNIFTHMWSLGVEEQFYFLYPLLFWLAGVPRRHTSARSKLFGLILVASLASLLLWLFLSQTNQVAAYFLMPARLWEMGMGCLVCLAIGRCESWPITRIQGIGLAVVGAMVAVLFLPQSANIVATPLIILLTSLFLIAVRPGSRAYAAFTQPQIVFIGLISYSLYLWHWGVLCLSRWTLDMKLWMVPFQYALILLLAVLSYRWIEKPLRKASWSPRLGGTLAIGLAATGVSAALLVMVASVLRRVSPIQPNPEMAYETHLVGWSSCDGKPIGLGGKKDGNCYRLDHPPYPTRVVVLGDSHAGQLASGLRSIIPDLPTSMRLYFGGRCFPTIDADAKLDANCSIVTDGFEWVKSTSSVDVVLLSGYHNLILHKNRYHWRDIDIARMSPGALDSLEQSLGRTIQELNKAGKWVVMVVDSHELMALPEESINPRTGLLRATGSLSVPRDQVLKRNKPYYDMLKRLRKRYSAFRIFYTGNHFCTPTTCRSDWWGRPLFQTRDHLTPYGSRVVAAELKPLLLRLLQVSEASRNQP